MPSEKTVLLNDKSYTWTDKGWIETHSRLKPDATTARKLDKLAQQAFRAEDATLSDPDQLLSQASNARANQQFMRAEYLIRQALRLAPDHMGAYAMLSAVLRDKGLPQQALDETQAIRRTDYPPLLTSRAAAYCDLERWEEAVKELKPVLAMGGSEEAFSVVQRIKKARPDLYGKR